MIAIMNETQIWHCDICVETNIIFSRLRYVNSKKHIQKKYGTVVKEYEFYNPDLYEVNYILNNTLKDCKNIFFQSFENRCIFDIKFKNMENIEEVILTITIGYKKFKSQFYGLGKKIKNAMRKGFVFSEIVKLTKKLI